MVQQHQVYFKGYSNNDFYKTSKSSQPALETIEIE